MSKIKTKKQINEAINHIKKICESKNIRFTKLRHKVLEIILSDPNPSKAYDILKKLDLLEKNNQGVGVAMPSTVYRTINFLIENGFIHKIKCLNAYTPCDHPQKHERCYFMVCSCCGSTKECCDESLTSAIDKIVTKNNFKSTDVNVEIIGKCQTCTPGSCKCEGYLTSPEAT